MALFKVTTKRRFTSGKERMDPGMSVEVHVNGSTSVFSLGLARKKELVASLFGNKYGIELKPAHVEVNNFEVECLSKR